MSLFGRKRKPQEPTCTMVVVAAGSSQRMGQDKMFLELEGQPVLAHTLLAMEGSSRVDQVVVVTREDLVGAVANLCRELGLSKVKTVVRGGATRVESARLGTMEVPQDAKLIGIHDGARPFVSSQVMERVVDQAAQAGAAAPAIPVQDTVKVAHNGVVDHTPDRATLFAVQTPQVFDADLIRGALAKALLDNAPLTDDCSAVERLGMPVSLVEGDRNNIKLTTPADLAVARVILEGWNQ
ncbi:2-C-methyl-D-erythritol 4-phosphate cytidylyltransferase [Pseudoflavonifractor sp. An85]|uniref:2-C-methyl-D-erythritol 4-phosphate cytidylyltransferase n=1 Tax=Pseudoflavonifractor sp. An85 TaxID=1965661 RepID=UPI000B3AA081|nr:2-C-methyl-D-erythritol 4-phosphate cytidylyltransferase [Pseudoflavonifractor sp. An85]OUN25023.1 2-C-methyl-D-erythritol 4-phosphate cytidylyltransferase [Pseudoflavonifractor sp. An85]